MKRNTIRLSDDDWAHILTVLRKGTPDQRVRAKRIEAAREITDRERLYIAGADDLNIVRDGELEVDSDAIVSEFDGDDKENGAYVQAWLWVTKDHAGVFDAGDSVLFDPLPKDGTFHPDIDHIFVGTIVGTMKRDTDESRYYSVRDQDEDVRDIDAKYLKLHYED